MTAIVQRGEDVDVAALMRTGHPQIAEGDRHILGLVGAFAAEKGGDLRIFNVGCGSGWLARSLVELLPCARVIANEMDVVLVEQLRRRLAGTRAEITTVPFEDWTEPVDVVISWGSHHHLPRPYTDHVRRLIGDRGIFILGDEFCPEYCDESDVKRLRAAKSLAVVEGYLLTSEDEAAELRRTGRPPAAALAMERRRRRALWRWYRYVVDHAVERDCFEVAIHELRAAHDDLITSFGEEHKMSAGIVERDMELRGYRMLSRKSFGPRGEPQHQSFVVYEYAAQ